MIAASSIALPQTEQLALQKRFTRITQSTVIKADSASQKTASSFCAEPSQIPQGFIINCAPPTHCSLWDGSAVTGSGFLTGFSVHNWDLSGDGQVFPSIFPLCPASLVPCSLGNFLFACFLIFFSIFFQRGLGRKGWRGRWMPFFQHSEIVCQTHLNLSTPDLSQELVDSCQGRRPGMQQLWVHTHIWPWIQIPPDMRRDRYRIHRLMLESELAGTVGVQHGTTLQLPLPTLGTETQWSPEAHSKLNYSMIRGVCDMAVDAVWRCQVLLVWSLIKVGPWCPTPLLPAEPRSSST